MVGIPGWNTTGRRAMPCAPDLAPRCPPVVSSLRRGSVGRTVFCLTARPQQHLCRDEPWGLNDRNDQDKRPIKACRAPASRRAGMNTQRTVAPGQCQNRIKFQPVRRVLIPAQKGSALHVADGTAWHGSPACSNRYNKAGKSLGEDGRAMQGGHESWNTHDGRFTAPRVIGSPRPPARGGTAGSSGQGPWRS
jgi:hypothetical protein